MGLARRIDKEHAVVVVIGTGATTAEDFVAETRAQVADPPLPGAFNILYDLRDSHFEGDLAPLKELAQEVQRLVLPFNQRVAQIVSEDHEFGLTRLFDSRAAGGSVEHRVFRDAAEARRWVGLPEE